MSCRNRENRSDPDPLHQRHRRSHSEYRGGGCHPELLRSRDHKLRGPARRCRVAIGMSWSGLLGNFAVGVLLIILQPFKVGDFVTAGGVTGTVDEVGLFVISINTPDNIRTIVGNGKMFADVIQKLFHQCFSSRRADGATFAHPGFSLRRRRGRS